MRAKFWKSIEMMGRGLIVAAGLSVVASAAMADFERRDIEFNADGTTLRGWFYTPANATGPVPTIVMAHGWSAVKEMWLDKYAEEFANAGMAAVVYDNRNFGATVEVENRDQVMSTDYDLRPGDDHAEVAFHLVEGERLGQ